MSTFGFVFTLHYFALLFHSLEMLRNFGYAIASGGVFAIMGISLNIWILAKFHISLKGYLVIFPYPSSPPRTKTWGIVFLPRKGIRDGKDSVERVP